MRDWLAGPLRTRLLLVLLIALAQGICFALVVPPWQHYDEPTHFEYVRRYADLGRRPSEFDRDVTLRREIAASMVAYKLFAPTGQTPALLTDSPDLWIGVPEFYHPPLYYLIAAQPLRLLTWLPLEAQLYALRLLSAGLLVLVVAVAAGLAAELAAPEHPIRWLLPLSLALLPTLADTVTAVNNDGASILLVSLLLWLCVRLIMRGVTLLRLGGALLVLALGIVTKTTAAIGLVLLPIALVIALWARRGWRWRWLALAVFLPAALALVLLLSWDDAAFWYRDAALPSQREPTRTTLVDGTPALQLVTDQRGQIRRLLSPLPAQTVQQSAGQQLTLGGWLWTDSSAAQAELALQTIGGQIAFSTTGPLTLTTTPRFVTFTTLVPTDTQIAIVELRALPTAGSAKIIYMNQPLVVRGPEPVGTPVFSQTAAAGSWDGQPFVNLLRGSDLSQRWPRVRPAVDDVISGYLRRSVSQIVAALADVDRVGLFLLAVSASVTLPGLVQTYGWGQLELDLGWGRLALALLVLAAAIGGVVWIVRGGGSRSVRLALLFLLTTLGSVWFGVLSRPLPALDSFPLPVARYLLPAALPLLLLLIGGYLLLWPRRFRVGAALLWTVALLALDLAAIQLLGSAIRAI